MTVRRGGEREKHEMAKIVECEAMWDDFESGLRESEG